MPVIFRTFEELGFKKPMNPNSIQYDIHIGTDRINITPNTNKNAKDQWDTIRMYGLNNRT